MLLIVNFWRFLVLPAVLVCLVPAYCMALPLSIESPHSQTMIHSLERVLHLIKRSNIAQNQANVIHDLFNADISNFRRFLLDQYSKLTLGNSANGIPVSMPSTNPTTTGDIPPSANGTSSDRREISSEALQAMDKNNDQKVDLMEFLSYFMYHFIITSPMKSNSTAPQDEILCDKVDTHLDSVCSLAQEQPEKKGFLTRLAFWSKSSNSANHLSKTESNHLTMLKLQCYTRVSFMFEYSTEKCILKHKQLDCAELIDTCIMISPT